MIRSLLFITLLLSSPLSFAGKKSATILVVGDSLSAAYGIDPQSGWVSLLALKVAQKKQPHQVINASISGDTTINGVKRLPSLLNKYRPDIVIIELGANDGLRGLSLKAMQNNLRQMVELCLQSDARVLLAGMKIPPNYGKRYTTVFNNTYVNLAKEYKLSLVPFLLEGVGTNSELMQADGLHPSKDAQPVILQTVWEQLKLIL
ncbi:MAG: arylesterase [Gammaproteobacteria bacterium]|nr:arylesterase [Gammaproteobacteria bacterium]